MKRLFRSSSNRMITGICGGLGEYFNVDPTIVRIIFLVLLIPLNFGLVIAYLIGTFIIPHEKGVK